MLPEHFARLYNGAHGADVRLVDKEREQMLHMAGRGFPGGAGNVGFHIELGEDRETDRRRVVYDSSERDHDWTEDSRNRGNAGEEGYNGMVGGRSEVSGSHSDGSEDYEEEELDLEADGRDVVAETVGGERSSQVPSLSQISSQDGAAGPFQRMNADRERASKTGVPASQKFGMFSFFNSFSSPGSHENGVGRDRAGNGEAGVPDSLYFNTIVNSAAGSAEKRLPPQVSDNSVRHFLSDPISGALMDEAVIFPCGHSVGAAGFQRVQETNACCVCMSPTAPMSAAPNYALRQAVAAFKRDREFSNLTSSRSAKRRRDDDESGKVKGVQFPYSVSDRVLIKGNKRTPERFVGREAIITTQCLNGWYLVRTIDNGESVRLQYRSLQKIGD